MVFFSTCIDLRSFNQIAFLCGLGTSIAYNAFLSPWQTWSPYETVTQSHICELFLLVMFLQREII